MPTSPLRPNPPPQSANIKQEPELAGQELAPEDFYFEGPYIVFTAAYHLNRGYCCHSGCRHCPYSDNQ